MGKTALALHWAHQGAARYPDGQLYVNLRGYDTDRPVPAASALAWFLRALGVAGPDIPPEPDERAALTMSREIGHPALEVNCLVYLARIDLRAGRCEQASDRLAHALARSRELGGQSVETVTSTSRPGPMTASPAVTRRWVRPAGAAATGSVPWPCSPAWVLRKPGRSGRG